MVGGNENTFQGGAEYKGIHTNLCHEIGDGDARQGIAVGERAVTDGGNGIGDGDARQGLAAGERTVSNGNNGIGDGDANQGIAAEERAVSNSSNPLRNVISCVLPSFRIRNQTAICFTE